MKERYKKMEAIIKEPQFKAWDGKIFPTFNSCFLYEQELLIKKIISGIRIFDEEEEYCSQNLLDLFINPYADPFLIKGYVVIDINNIDLDLCRAIIQDENNCNYSDYYSCEDEYFSNDFVNNIKAILNLKTGIYTFENELDFSKLIPIEEQLFALYNLSQKAQVSFNYWILMPQD